MDDDEKFARTCSFLWKDKMNEWARQKFNLLGPKWGQIKPIWPTMPAAI